MLKEDVIPALILEALGFLMLRAAGLAKGEGTWTRLAVWTVATALNYELSLSRPAFHTASMWWQSLYKELGRLLQECGS